jgi:site-specific DNA-methyltransferase (adenine-specific)
MLPINQVYFGDCLDWMPLIDDKSIDMILCDLPYGITACKWDCRIDLEKLWEQYKRIIKDHGCIALFGSEPFSSYLRMSNIKWYKYDWIWEKTRFSNQMLAKRQPLKIHEIISIFYRKFGIYNPQDLKVFNKVTRQGKKITDNIHSKVKVRKEDYYQKYTNYPKSIQLFKNQTGLHSTQKPVKLYEYLIKTYTNPNQLILDNCAGSGTIIEACLNTSRNFIAIEKEEKYYNNCLERYEKCKKVL